MSCRSLLLIQVESLRYTLLGLVLHGLTLPPGSPLGLTPGLIVIKAAKFWVPRLFGRSDVDTINTLLVTD